MSDGIELVKFYVLIQLLESNVIKIEPLIDRAFINSCIAAQKDDLIDKNHDKKKYCINLFCVEPTAAPIMKWCIAESEL